MFAAAAAISPLVMRSGSALAQTTADFTEVSLWPEAYLPKGQGPSSPELWVERSNKEGKVRRAITAISRPRLIVVRPQKPNGAAVMVVPGGSYAFLYIDKEGFEVAKWLAAAGFTAFILLYRLPGEGWSNQETVPLADAMRAIRLIRHRSWRYGIDPERVSILGFSAGGHLCGSLATAGDAPVYMPVDDADNLSARPASAGLIYPVISMKPGLGHAGSRSHLLGDQPIGQKMTEFSVEERVKEVNPPMFLAHARDDTTVSVDNSLVLWSALRRFNIPCDLHLFSTGGHGFVGKYITASGWPQLFVDWLNSAAVRHDET
ncbi:alpha/beta hydrolase [Sphingobium sp. AP50]|uniref:alpha/beta hydrolase n=1 Tax=Sphingobium sp. AP50 TaxID=1884369 RepID=UPI000B860BD0|nr:alpha/beta hydrolase [Sphingobium sp. AP50]